VNDIDRLRQEEEELARQLAEVRKKRARLEQGSTHAAPNIERKLIETSRSLRDMSLDLLSDARVPLNSLLLSAIIGPLFGRAVPSTRFGTLSMDEQASFDSKRIRPVYLCHGLTHDQGIAMKRIWGRSDWPLTERIIGPLSSRTLFLRGARWVIDLAAKNTTAADPDRLKYLAADQARDAGLQVRRGEFEFADWIAAIDEQLEKLLPEDEALRARAAELLATKLSERELLFGAQPPFVSLPGSRAGWKSAHQ
jgi:hypothetical protein